MHYLQSFLRFWVDFIAGDAWEVAVALGLTLIVISVLADRYGDNSALGFVFLASVLIVTWIALRRTTE